MNGRLRLPHRRLLLVLLLLAGIWFQWHSRAGRAPARHADDRDSTRVIFAAGGRDLAADEATGGHTLTRHVGKSDQELAARLERESGLALASSFADRAVAEHAVGSALAAEQRRIAAWSTSGRGETLAISWHGDGAPVGRLLERGAAARTVGNVRVVLRRRAGGWFVLTAYPEDHS